MDEEIEARLIEQEHRFLRVVGNLIEYRSAPSGDARKKAAYRALAWRILSPGTAVATGLGITAVASVVIALYTTLLLQQQNSKLDQQTHLAEAARTSALASELGAVIGQINAEVSNACIPSAEPGKESKALPSCWRDVLLKDRPRWLRAWSLRRSSGGQRVRMTPSDRQSLDLLERGDVDIRHASLPLSPELNGRVVAISNALRPYRFVTVESLPVTLDKTENWIGGLMNWLRLSPNADSPTLSPKPQSIERGVLLSALMENVVEIDSAEFLNSDFRYSLARDRDFSGLSFNSLRLDYSDFTCSTFEGTYLENTHFQYAELTAVSFRGADASGAIFHSANLRDADLSGADLPDGGSFRPSDLTGAQFEGARVSGKDWLAEFMKYNPHGVRGFNSQEWKVMESRDARGLIYELRRVGGAVPHLGRMECIRHGLRSMSEIRE